MDGTLINKKQVLLGITLATTFVTACTFSVSPVYNSNLGTAPEVRATPASIANRDDLKSKAIDQVKTFHRFLEDGMFEDAYKMIDDDSSLKHPKDNAIDSLKAVVDTLGKLEQLDLSRDNVVEDKSVNGGQLQVRQEFTVTFEKDTAPRTRYALFIWNVYPGDKLKLWAYINGKGDD